MLGVSPVWLPLTSTTFFCCCILSYPGLQTPFAPSLFLHTSFVSRMEGVGTLAAVVDVVAIHL